MTETLCWTCERSGTNGCCWDKSRGKEPVEGWKAVKTRLKMQGHGVVDSYAVIYCPLYRESETARRYRERKERKEAERKV